MKFLKQKTKHGTAARGLLVVIAALGFLFFSQVNCKKSGGSSITPPPTTLQELVAYVSSPQELLSWMESNISWGWPGAPDMDTWRYFSPQDVFTQNQGDCTAQAAFESYILSQNGYECHLLWLERASNVDHAVCYWQASDGLYYMEHAFGGNEGLYGPFNTVQDIGTQIYDQMIANDGLTDNYALFHYDDVPYGVNWIEFHQRLTPIP